MSTGNLDASVRALADKEAIRDLARRYAHCVWRKDVPGVVELFSDDGEMQVGDDRVVRGRAELLAEFERMITGSDLLPFVHDHLVELHGDSATGVCHVHLFATMGTQSMVGAGSYEDCYVRAAGGWRIQSRRLRLAFFAPIREGWAGR